LKSGADVNIQNEKGATAFVYCSGYDSKEVVTLLIEHGVVIDLEDDFFKILLKANILRNGGEVAKLLIEHGVSGYIKGIDALNALHAAVIFYKKDLVSLLIESDKRIIDLKTEDGYSLFILM